MSPQLVDRAYTDSCVVIGCNLVQPLRKMNTFISGRSHIAVIIVNNALGGVCGGDVALYKITLNTYTHIHSFNGPFSRTTRVSRYQKGKINLDFTEARDSEWQWHQLGRMQVCTSLHTDNHASTPPLKFFYRPDALPATQPTASKH